MITPYPKNPRIHSDRQLELLAKSIKRFGWQQPIKVGKDNVIIVGHGRWFSYDRYKDEFELNEPWIINEEGITISGQPETRKLTKQEEQAYRMVDNRLNQMAQDDEWLMKEEALDFKEDEDLVELIETEERKILQSVDFQPNVNPETNYEGMTHEELVKKAKELETKFQQEAKLIEVVCPECAHEFKVNK